MPLGIGLFPTADAEHNTQDFHQDSSNQSLSPSCFDSKAWLPGPALVPV